MKKLLIISFTVLAAYGINNTPPPSYEEATKIQNEPTPPPYEPSFDKAQQPQPNPAPAPNIVPNLTPEQRALEQARKAFETQARQKRLQDRLYRGVMNNSEQEIRTSVAEGADIVNRLGREVPLVTAIQLARPIAVKTLLALGANAKVDAHKANSFLNPNYKFGSLIDISLGIGDIESALALLRHGLIDNEIRRQTEREQAGKLNVMITAVLNNLDQVPEICLEFMQELINRGYNINNPIGEGNIWSISLRSEIQNIQPLLDLLARNNINIPEYIYPQPNQPTTPLLFAIERDNVQTVKFLCARGVNVNQVNPWLGRQAQTPLALAQGRVTAPEMVQILRQHGAQ